MIMKFLRRSVLVIFGLLYCASAQATYHLWQIAELFTNTDGSLQFIRLTALSGGQQFISGHTIRSTANGATKSYTFPTDLPGDSANRNFLIATEGFAALNLVTPDYVVPNGFLATSNGVVNFAESADVFSYAALPTDGILSLNRSGTQQSNTPQNFAGANGSIASPKTGWWWNPGEGGRGFAIEKSGNNLFMAGYLYDSSGRATWVAAGPAAMSGSSFTSALNVYNGGQTLTGAYKPPTGPTAIGTISINFTDASNGTLTWAGGTIPIQRFDIVSGGAAMTPASGTPEAGWWWNAGEGGRGYAIEIQNGTLFMAGYMYDSSGNPTWYASGPAATSTSTTDIVDYYGYTLSTITRLVYQGTWTQYGNGQTLTGAYQPAAVVNGNAGSIRIEFANAKTATLTLPDGRQIALSRFAF